MKGNVLCYPNVSQERHCSQADKRNPDVYHYSKTALAAYRHFPQ